MNPILLKTPIYLTDAGSDGAGEMFLLALFGGVLLFVAIKLAQKDIPFISTFAEVIFVKLSIACILTGIISGIISLL